MATELNLSFSDPTRISVHLLGEPPDQSQAFDFVNPLDDDDLEDIRWYLENYGIDYAAEPDDQRAERITGQLRDWGEQLFDAVFKADDKTFELYRNFYDQEEPGRLLTIAANHPAVLSLPWELLRPANGVFLFAEDPRISIRRRLPGSGQNREPRKREPKSTLRLLFIVSRPWDAAFIDPRADPQAVIEALDQQAGQDHDRPRVDVEFLRPATLAALQQRLRDNRLPAVDIIHFDGHGAFDRHGTLAAEAATTSVPEFTQALLREAESRGEVPLATTQQGYLLFEDEDGMSALVDARSLGELLFHQKIGLVVLSACQSATMGEDDAMGGVSAWLTQAGIPSVLAMTHSVLVATTRALFGSFYSSLLQGKTVGGALDDARAQLYFDPRRGERLRGEGGGHSISLKLSDWFLPTLYQAGRDQPLLEVEAPGTGTAGTAGTSSAVPVAKVDASHNLPPLQESGFFGRSRELWAIERGFAVQGIRRYSITGFGGQGKTYLAIEAGHWLQRSGLFQRICLVSYAGFQGHDPVGVALSTLGTVLGRSLIDTAAAEAALAESPTLLILDNLETLDTLDTLDTLAADTTMALGPDQPTTHSANPHPDRVAADGLTELLSAAVGWSRAGDSRVLLTARQPDFNHPGYPLSDSLEHQCLALNGLAPQDALDWFAELMRLPPKPADGLPRHPILLSLFTQVDYHPLSIALLAQQLKERPPTELGERLETLLEAIPPGREDRSLLASLELSLERLPEQTRAWLPRLGVFQGGTLEKMLIEMLGFSDDIDDDEELSAEQIEELRDLLPTLQRTGLIQPQRLTDAGMIWLRFHPTLAPALWQRLDDKKREALTRRHRQYYYRLANDLYDLDPQNPLAAREMARAELPNLLHAVYATLAAGEKSGADFADSVSKFLDDFGLRREHQALAQAAADAANNGDQAAVGSKPWYLARSNLGKQMLGAGQVGEAEAVFRDVLAELGETPSYERCQTLGRLGRCRKARGRLEDAAALYRQKLEEIAELEPTQEVQRETGTVHLDLADVLRHQGDYAGARDTYETSLEIIEKMDDDRTVAVINGQLGTLALLQQNLQEAERRHQEALRIFRLLDEPAMEAAAQHQLGRTYQEAGEWDAAEQAYRHAAHLFESQGDANTGTSWDQLAQVIEAAGRSDEAEAWYRKAITARKQAGDQLGIAKSLGNLASLLLQQTGGNPAVLAEALTLAEESLVIGETIDPAAAQIWNTYTILAEIVAKQGDEAHAAEYRVKARHAQAGFAGARHQLRQYGPLIAAVAAAAAEPGQRAGLEPDLTEMAGRGWGKLVNVISRVLDGERNEGLLCEPLDGEDAMIIQTILTAITDPTSLDDLLQTPDDEGEPPSPGDPVAALPEELRQMATVIAASIQRPELRPQLDPLWQQLREQGRGALVDALQTLYTGSTDPTSLLEGLGEQEQVILGAVLQMLE
jgi:tetratricopeptide (TPR) repeat protein